MRTATATRPPVQGHAFPMRLRSDPKVLRQALEDQGTLQGEAEILVAVFDIPDTEVAWGNTVRQVIDRGAFRAWLASDPFPAPFFLDHGEAMRLGSHSAQLLIGEVTAGEETDEGLLVRVSYDLEDPKGRSAFGKLIKYPKVVGFSFADEVEREIIELRDGQEHLTEMWPFEFSQVGFGAQRAAHVVAARSSGPARARSLDDLPAKIRKAWGAQLESIARALDGWGWPEETFAEDGDETGYVIAAFEGGRFLRVSWYTDDEGGIQFRTDDVAEMEQEWVEARAAAERGAPAIASALRQPATKRALAEALVADRALAADLRAAADKALEEPEPPAEPPADPPADDDTEDPVATFYRGAFGR